jgi:hypothetical protein
MTSSRFVSRSSVAQRDVHRERSGPTGDAVPVEALQAVRQLRMAGCSNEEKARFAALVRSLETLVIRISQLVPHRQLLQDIAEPRLRLQFECLEVEFNQLLDAFRECLDQGDCRRPLPALRGALAGLDRAVRARRSQPAPIWGRTARRRHRLLDQVDRYRATAEAMEGAAACWAPCSSNATGGITPCSRLLRVLPQQPPPSKFVYEQSDCM